MTPSTAWVVQLYRFDPTPHYLVAGRLEEGFRRSTATGPTPFERQVVTAAMSKWWAAATSACGSCSSHSPWCGDAAGQQPGIELSSELNLT